MTAPQELPKPGAFVYHRQYRVLGKVVKLYEPGTYISPHNPGGRPLSCAVVELDDGSSFIGDPANFLEVGADSPDFAANVVGGLREFLNGAFENAKTFGLPPWVTFELIAAALEKAAGELRAAADDSRPEG